MVFARPDHLTLLVLFISSLLLYFWRVFKFDFTGTMMQRAPRWLVLPLPVQNLVLVRGHPIEWWSSETCFDPAAGQEMFLPVDQAVLLPLRLGLSVRPAGPGMETRRGTGCCWPSCLAPVPWEPCCENPSEEIQAEVVGYRGLTHLGCSATIVRFPVTVVVYIVVWPVLCC